jgi:hypothetical protein
MKRVGQSLFSTVSDARMAGAQGIREEIMGRFAERIAKDCNGRFAMLDFFEVRFDLAFARFRKTVLRQIGPSSVLTEPLSTGEEGQDISPEVEEAAADFLGGDPQKIDDPAFRLELDAAIDALPDDQRRVVGLLRQGFQIDSKDPNIMTIAKMLKCDERTVRNRRPCVQDPEGRSSGGRMSTSKPFAADEESVLLAFSMEPSHGRKRSSATSASTRSMRLR